MKRNKFIVIGCGRFGGQVATERSVAGMDVIVIDQKEDAFRKLQEAFTGFQLVGDATQLEVLESGFIQEAEYVLIATNNDNINLVIAHICDRIFQVPYIYLRLMDSEKEQLVESQNIKPIFPYKLSLQSFQTIFDEDNL